MTLFLYDLKRPEVAAPLVETLLTSLKVPLTGFPTNDGRFLVPVPDERAAELKEKLKPDREIPVEKVEHILSPEGRKYFQRVEATVPERIYFHHLTPPVGDTIRGAFFTHERHTERALSIVESLGGFGIEEAVLCETEGGKKQAQIFFAIPKGNVALFIQQLAFQYIAGYDHVSQILFRTDDAKDQYVQA